MFLMIGKGILESCPANQKMHDSAFMEKTETKSAVSKSNRTEYMRQYMQKRRERESFREQNKAAARVGMQKKRETNKENNKTKKEPLRE